MSAVSNIYGSHNLSVCDIHCNPKQMFKAIKKAISKQKKRQKVISSKEKPFVPETVLRKNIVAPH